MQTGNLEIERNQSTDSSDEGAEVNIIRNQQEMPQ